MPACPSAGSGETRGGSCGWTKHPGIRNDLRMRRGIALAAIIAVFMALGGEARGQAVTIPVQGTAPAPQVAMPNAEKIVLLLRGTLLTLNDAIQTGNFTVLRDRGAPGFRDANSAGRLAQIFSDLTAKGIDLSVVTVVTPQLNEPPGLDQQNGMLRLKGYFPGKPVQIDFEVLYQAVGGQWRLFGLSVQPGAPTPPQSASDPAGSAVKKK